MEVVCLVRSVGTAKHLGHLLTAPSHRVSLSNSAPMELREMGNKQRGQLYISITAMKTIKKGR